METDYNTERDSRKRKWTFKRAFSLWVTGITIGFGGFTYSMINAPYQPPVVERYKQIERELKTPTDSLTLRNLESRSAELIARANKLETKLSEILTSNSNLNQVREEYERERQNNKKTGSYIMWGGILVALSSIISGFLLRRKEEDNGNEKSYEDKPRHVSLM